MYCLHRAQCTSVLVSEAYRIGGCAVRNGTDIHSYCTALHMKKQAEPKSLESSAGNAKPAKAQFSNNKSQMKLARFSPYRKNASLKNIKAQLDSKALSISPIIHYLHSDYLLYNSYINEKVGSLSYNCRRKLIQKFYKLYSEQLSETSAPLIVQMHSQSSPMNELSSLPVIERSITQSNFPLSQYMEVECSEVKENPLDNNDLPTISTTTDMAMRMEDYNYGDIPAVSLKSQPETHLGTEIRHAMSMERVVRVFGNAYYEDPSAAEQEMWQQLGTSDPKIPATSVPCGGCGALFHCHDPSIPGYKPREMIVGVPKAVLSSTVCARCYFLTVHNTALQVRVSPESYLDILRPIRDKNCLVLLLVDLTDAPCSINPNIMQIISDRHPVIVVGTKVDLLPMDTDGCLDRLHAAFAAMLAETPLSSAHVLDVCLVSARTGFGIECLVTSVMQHWSTRGDVYMLGSVNAGKSTLFNALLQSDLCESVAENLLLRATTSAWPGTTLSMLKFPLQRCTGKMRFLRKLRLEEQHLQRLQECRALSTRGVPRPSFSPLTALAGAVGRTFVRNAAPQESLMPDVFKESPGAPGPAPTKGISDNNPRYRSKKWVHDTPGVVQPDQLVSLLTHEELQEALPQSPIVPQTFRVRRGTSLLLGGLARLDILYVHHPVPRSRRLKPSDYVLATVFRSNALPVSVIRTVEASAFYRDNLGGKLLGVPRHGGEMLGTPYPERELLGTPRPGGERLKFWPPLLPSDTFRVTGVTNLLPLPRGARLIASADLVLSSAGWVSLAVTPFSVCEVRLWTPGGRGMYLRSPSFLPHAPLLRGRRAPGCVDYEPHQQPDPAEPPEPSDIFRSSPQNYAKYLGLLDDAE